MHTAPRESPVSNPYEPLEALARQLRLLLDRAQITPRRLAAGPDVPYSLQMLYRVLAGHLLPPVPLVELTARRCDGTEAALRHLHGRAVRAAEAAAGAAAEAAEAAEGAAADAGGHPSPGRSGHGRPPARHARPVRQGRSVWHG